LAYLTRKDPFYKWLLKNSTVELFLFAGTFNKRLINSLIESGAGIREGAGNFFAFIDVPREKVLRDFPFHGEGPAPRNLVPRSGWVEEFDEGDFLKYHYKYHNWCGTQRGESYEQRRRKRYYLKQYYLPNRKNTVR
jgi:hypothetical protein